ncbi:putative Golgi apparatus membrane protein tvp18 [Lineolata rhizophorae]|uniref:Putative Golgi apparatus membrane protein tvp18 n=1 Tax=Lineolata rhizophorae TaxID=578093 RepID=A0A6A6NPQ4_9PEZI|nr:putative Golgi apparatus membrane protein tvp18 [Lineolata rhizophorae]
MTIADEFRSRNFSIYGQWIGVLCIVLCIAIGIANIFSSHIIFGIICLISGVLLIFVEIPLLLRICPTSAKFDAFVRKFETLFMRAAIYAVMSAVQWVSLVQGPSSLIAPAVFLILAAICYLLAAIKGQGFVGSKTLGGQGVAQMII